MALPLVQSTPRNLNDGRTGEMKKHKFTVVYECPDCGFYEEDHLEKEVGVMFEVPIKFHIHVPKNGLSPYPQYLNCTMQNEK
jgi:hypothetical protein